MTARNILPIALLVLLGSVFSALAQDSDVRVYRLDGSLQCGMGQARSLAEDKEVLEKLGAKVISEEKRTSPAGIIALCGAPTGRANTYVIAKADWDKILRGIMGPVGFMVWDAGVRTVQVYKYDGSVQCGGSPPIPLDEMAKQLTGAGVRIVSQRKSTDGLFHVAICGTITGAINVYEIDISELQKARDQNFAVLIVPPPSPVSATAVRAMISDFRPMAEGLPLPWPFPW